MSALKVLVVDDDPTIREALQLALEDANINVTCLPSAEDALQWLLTDTADLLILDWMLPGISGIDLVKILRFKTHTESLPIILLSARNQEEDKLSSFELGADDYMLKPFSTKELIARIQAIMRKHKSDDRAEFLKVADLLLDSDQRQLQIGEHRLDLTPVEYKLLEFLMRHPEKVHTRDELLEEVWGRTIYIEERTVDVQIRRLRLRLAGYDRAAMIQTVRGLGYRLSVPKSESG
ncbi:response regulator [Methylomonas sp. MgM2]